MRLHKILFTCFLVLCSLFPLGVHAAGITNYPVLINPTYWTAQNKDGDKIVLDSKGVADFNVKIRTASRTVANLAAYPATFDGDSLKTKIMNYSVLDDDLYLHGNKVSENYKNILRKQTNVAAIPSIVNIRYAVVVRRSAMRTLPTGEGLYYYAADKEFDALQETALDPGEPVLVLHTSANGFFYYVQSINYSGWVSKFNLALTDRNNWLTFARPSKFLVVTDANYVLKTNGENVIYQQGSRLPVDSEQSGVYNVLAPVRTQTGNLQKQRLLVPKSAPGINYGYLPYTTNNIIRSAFKFYGMPYGWGGLKDSVDCSSLVYNVYRTVGIYLPRNADEQEQSAGTKYPLSATSTSRTNVINNLQPGAGLYMDGHTLLYLGKINNVPYAIHALGSYYQNGVRHNTMKVVVSDLSLARANGNTFTNELTTAIEFK